MRIERIHIDSFMGTRERDIEFDRGVNILRGDNESGKSTVSEFIKFMLYGASARGADGEMAERAKYLSFGDAAFGGYMELTTAAGRFRIDRKISVTQSGAFRESLAISDLDKKAQVFKGENAGDALLGIPENVFKKVAYISQEDESHTGGAELSNAIENLLFSGDETVSTDKALKKLDSLRVSLLHKNGKGGMIYECEKERAELEALLEKASSDNMDIIAKEGGLLEVEKSMQEKREDYSRAKKLCELYDNYVAFTKFKKLDEANDEKDKITVAKAELESRYGGFIPDGEYLGKLRHTKETLEAYDRSVTTARAKYENAQAARTAAENSYTDGGDTTPLESAAANLGKVRALAKRLTFFGILLVLLGVLGIAATVFLKQNPIFYVGAGAVAVLGIVLLIISGAKKKKISAALVDFCVANEAELVERAKEMTDAGARSQNALSRAREAESTASALLENEEERYAEAKENFAAEASRIHKSADNADELFATVEEYIAERNELYAREKVVLSQIKTLESETAVYEREAVEKILFAVGDLSVFEKFDIVEYRRKRDFSENAISALEIRRSDLEKSLAALRATAQNPALIKATLDTLCKKESAARAKYDAATLAISAIEKASEGLRTRVSPNLAEYAGKLMSVITDGKYTDIGVDAEMGLTFLSDGGAHDVAYLSKGTRESAYFTLRLALCNLLCKEEKLPLVLDECFAHADDVRTKQTLKVLFALAAEETQSIILTCHTREEKLAESIGLFNLIEM
ncbi:MAG: AAA family ATPase [Clostridia bacterium]|nr:AAA family ATPase [Clostridia bacterium]